MCNAMHAVNSIGRPQIRFKRILSYRIIVILTFLFIGLIPSANAQIKWTPEAQISINDLYDDILPRLAASPDGSVWAVWIGSDGFDNEAYYSVYRDDEWSLPQRINTDDSYNQLNVDIAIGNDGIPWAVIRADDPSGHRLFYNKWQGSGWNITQPLFPDITAAPYSPARIEIDSENIPIAIWTISNEGGGGNLLYYSRCTDGIWSLPISIEPDSSSGWAESYNLERGDIGEVWCIWYRFSGHPTYDYEELYSRWTDDSWTVIDTIPLEIDNNIEFAIDSEGFPWITWNDYDDVYVSYFNGSTWSAPECVSVGDRFSNIRSTITFTSSENPIVSWVGGNIVDGNNTHDIYVNERVNLAWNNEHKLTSRELYSDGLPKVITSYYGISFVVWEGFDGIDDEIYYSRSSQLRSSSYNNIDSKITLSCYPNPVHCGSDLYIDLLSNCNIDEMLEFDIYNIKGQKYERKLYCRLVNNLGRQNYVINTQSFDGNYFAKGSYILSARIENQIIDSYLIILD